MEELSIEEFEARLDHQTATGEVEVTLAYSSGRLSIFEFSAWSLSRSDICYYSVVLMPENFGASPNSVGGPGVGRPYQYRLEIVTAYHEGEDTLNLHELRELVEQNNTEPAVTALAVVTRLVDMFTSGDIDIILSREEISEGQKFVVKTR